MRTNRAGWALIEIRAGLLGRFTRAHISKDQVNFGVDELSAGLRRGLALKLSEALALR